MMPTVLTPDTGMLIDDLTPTPATPHNLIRPRGDIYDGLKTHGLLDTEQANHLWDWLDDYDLELRLAVAADGRVFYQGHAKDDARPCGRRIGLPAAHMREHGSLRGCRSG